MGLHALVATALAIGQGAWLERADGRAVVGTLGEHTALWLRVGVAWGLVAGVGAVAAVAWPPVAARIERALDRRPGRLGRLGQMLGPRLVGVPWAVWPAAVAAGGFALWTPARPWPSDIAFAGAVAIGAAVALGRWAGPALVLATVAVVVHGLPPLPPPLAVGAPADPAPPLVLVTLDTLRADHVRAIGGPDAPAPTPALDALAARGRLFVEGVAPAPLTGPAHAGLLTGVSPLGRVQRNGDVLPGDVPTVAEALHAAGWRTGAFVSAAVLDRRVGLARGFDRYDDRFGADLRTADLVPWTTGRGLRWLDWPTVQRTGADTVDRALAWVAQATDRPTFLWVHLYDAHAPYTAPEVDDAALGDHGSAGDIEEWRRWAIDHGEKGGKIGILPPTQVRKQMRSYAGEVARVDAAVGRLVAALPADTRWVLAADHGESLVEHGYVLNHGRHVYQETTRVPLWVVAPGVAPERIETPVPSWWVGGTLLALAGLPPSSPTLVGSVVEEPIVTVAIGQEARRTLGPPKKDPELAYRVGPQVWVVGKDRDWRFDLAADPDQRDPQPPVPGDPDAAAARAALDAVHRPADRTSEWLEALGYVD